ncbi:hypothetical protein [Stenotrophomonas maltophilia]|uniref:hypothetical protein n=1 Tax=Stenotrophomonas maltophilia TaxID=40324 RepID=UPI0039C1CF7B
MSWKDGVSQCSPLAEKCHVWWEAWSAVGAVVGVLATVFLGLATLWLARSANKVSGMAVDIAENEAKERVKKEKLDGLLVLARIQTEVAKMGGIVEILRQQLTIRVPRYESDIEVFADWQAAIETIAFPVSNTLRDKFVYLEPAVAGHLSRALGLCDTLNDEWKGLVPRGDGMEMMAVWKELPLRLETLNTDLSAVRSACMAAIGTLDINPPALVKRFAEHVQQNG